MRASTTTLLLALASAASYTTALPIATTPSTVAARSPSPQDINAILAALRAHPDIPLDRPLKVGRGIDDLEARDFFSDFVQGFKEGFTGTIKTLGPLAVDLIKREASPEDISAILAALRAHPDIPLDRPLKVGRGVDDLEARDFFSDFVQGFKEGFTGTIKTLGPLAVDLIKKEDGELLARDFLSDFVQGFKEGFTGTIKTLGPLAVDLIKREASPEDINAILAALRAHPDIPLDRPLKVGRGIEDIEARDFFSDFVQGFKEGFTGTIKTLGPLAVDLIKKEDGELLARDFLSDFVQGFKEGFTGTIKTLGPLAVDLIKREASPEDINAILAALRAHPDIPLDRPLKVGRGIEDIEARDFFSDFVQGFKEGFTGTIKTLGPLAVDLIKKEDGELLARDFLSDFVQGFKEGFTGTIKTLGPLAVDLIKKEDGELLARDFLSDFVQGFKEGFTGTIKTLGPLAVDLIKKEDGELLARDFLSDFVQGFKEGFTGTIKTLGPLAVDLIKREASPEDINAILAALRAHPDIPLDRPLKVGRGIEDIEARDFFSDFVQGFKEGFTGTIKTLGPLAVDLIKKEDGELLARDFWSDFVQGFKEGFTGTIETLGPLAVDLIKKEDLEILARQFDSATLNNLD